MGRALNACVVMTLRVLATVRRAGVSWPADVQRPPSVRPVRRATRRHPESWGCLARAVDPEERQPEAGEARAPWCWLQRVCDGRAGKGPRCPSVGECGAQAPWSITQQQKRTKPCVGDNVMDLEDVMLSELSQRKTTICFAFMWNLQNKTNERKPTQRDKGMAASRETCRGGQSR